MRPPTRWSEVDPSMPARIRLNRLRLATEQLKRLEQLLDRLERVEQATRPPKAAPTAEVRPRYMDRSLSVEERRRALEAAHPSAHMHPGGHGRGSHADGGPGHWHAADGRVVQRR